jgi:hypothetical protein
VKIFDYSGAPEEWKGSAKLETELGQLLNIARRANLFFHNLDA